MAWKSKEAVNKEICQAVIADKSTEDLLQCIKVIDLYGRYKADYKLKNTYTKAIKRSLAYNQNGKIYCSYKSDTVKTGRLSCSAYKAGKKKNPFYGQPKEKEFINVPMGLSFHTLPRETSVNIRRAFISPTIDGEKWAFIAADFSAAELRILSHVADEDNMRNAFKNNLDLHSYAASLLYNKPIEDINKNERQIAKAVSFLIVFGGTEYTLSNNHAIPLNVAKQIIDKYLEVFPGVRDYIENSKRSISKNLYAETIFGRKRHLENAASKRDYIVERAYRQGINSPIQSPASDMVLCSVIGINKDFKKYKVPARFKHTVHDSIECIAKPSAIEDCLEIMHYNMVENPYMREVFGINLSVPMKIDAEVGFSFGDGEDVEFSHDGRVLNMDKIMEYMNAA